MLMQLIFQDIRYGFIRCRSRYAVFLMYMIVVSFGKCFYYQEVALGEFGLMGMLCNSTLAGIATYIPDSESQIVFPAGWLVMLLFIPYILGDCIEDEMKGAGLQKIVLSGRKKWWLSKCAWMLINSVIYITMFYGVQLCVSAIMNGGIADIEDDIWIYMSGYSDMLGDRTALYTYTIIIPCMCLIALSVWSSVLGMMCGSTNAFMFITIYLVFGIFYTSPYLIGNQLMLLRSSYIDPAGLWAETSIGTDFVLIVGGLLIGYSYIKNKNMINKD